MTSKTTERHEQDLDFVISLLRDRRAPNHAIQYVLQAKEELVLRENRLQNAQVEIENLQSSLSYAEESLKVYEQGNPPEQPDEDFEVEDELGEDIIEPPDDLEQADGSKR